MSNETFPVNNATPASSSDGNPRDTTGVIKNHANAANDAHQIFGNHHTTTQRTADDSTNPAPHVQHAANRQPPKHNSPKEIARSLHAETRQMIGTTAKHAGRRRAHEHEPNNETTQKRRASKQGREWKARQIRTHRSQSAANHICNTLRQTVKIHTIRKRIGENLVTATHNPDKTLQDPENPASGHTTATSAAAPSEQR